MTQLTQQRLKSVLQYDPETGLFTWLGAGEARRARFVGRIAGRVHKKRGYREISVDGRLYYAHRLAWLYMTGAMPIFEIDHMNHDRDDNKWSNLRDVSVSENQLNRREQGGARLYVKGQWVRWRATAQVNGQAVSLGYFETREQAISARLAFSHRAG